MGEPSHWKAEAYDWEPHKLVARAKVTSSRGIPIGKGVDVQGILPPR